MNLRSNLIYSFAFIGFLLTLCFVSCGSDKSRLANYNSTENIEKQCGAHVFRFRDSIDADYYQDHNIDWITLVPWGYQDDYQSSSIRHRWRGSEEIEEQNQRYIKRIINLKKAGFKVFVKPHIWLRNTPEGTWRSDVFPTSDDEWEIWMADYRTFILRYAEIAEIAKAEMFCVGTELTRLSLEKSAFWEELIVDIKKIYSGKLTYAANWYKEYEHISFWDQLDYIGVQAYFPLTKKENPNVKELEEGWGKHLDALTTISKKYRKPIIFTEIGYKSHSESGIKPWEWMDYNNIDESKFSEETQANCYKAFFNKVWINDWFHGAHLWQYRGTYRNKEIDLDFSPQGKMAESVIAEGFQQ